MSDNIDRVKNVAFWHWEYLRRNAKYYNYYSQLDTIMDELLKLGFDEFCQESSVEQYVSKHDKFPYEKELCKRYGKRTSLLFYKYWKLDAKFELKFGRSQRLPLEGLDTDKAFKLLLKDEPINFMTDDLDDILALLHLHQDWSITINDTYPNVSNLFHDIDSISIKPEALKENKGTVELEYQVLKFAQRLNDNEQEHLTSSDLNAVYNLCIKGKGISRANEKRLIALWVWDQCYVEETGKLDEEKGDECCDYIDELIKNEGLTGPHWNEFLERKRRFGEFFWLTCFSILHGHILPFSFMGRFNE